MPHDKPEAITDDAEGDKPLLFYTTFPNSEAAESCANTLVERGLVACANIIPGMVAIYAWNGQRHRDSEVVMILKTRVALAEAVTAAIKRQHPYDVPAIIAFAPVAGSADYLSWISAQTAAPHL
jgi:periplasmic divalent cation tolerance protein